MKQVKSFIYKEKTELPEYSEAQINDDGEIILSDTLTITFSNGDRVTVTENDKIKDILNKVSNILESK